MRTVWDGRSSLHDVFCDPRDALLWQTRDALLWQTRGNALVAAAPDLDGISKKRLTRHADARATRTQQQSTTLERRREAGRCVDCGERRQRVRSYRCAICAGAHAARSRDRRARMAE